MQPQLLLMVGEIIYRRYRRTLHRLMIGLTMGLIDASFSGTSVLPDLLLAIE